MIKLVLEKYTYHLFKTCKKLDDFVKKGMYQSKIKRKPKPLLDDIQNIPLLQELAYITHQEQIKTYLIQQEQRLEKERKAARESGQFYMCSLFVLLRDTIVCENVCVLCKSCVQRIETP